MTGAIGARYEGRKPAEFDEPHGSANACWAVLIITKMCGIQHPMKKSQPIWVFKKIDCNRRCVNVFLSFELMLKGSSRDAGELAKLPLASLLPDLIEA